MATQRQPSETKKTEPEGGERKAQPEPQRGLQQSPSGGGGTGVARRENQRWLSPALTSPLQMLRRLRADIDRMFSPSVPSPWLGADTEIPAFWPSQPLLWSPEIEVRERGEEIVVRADLPGIKKEDLNIEIVGNSLVLSGERQSEDEHEEPGYYRSERSYGSFQRVIALPEGADLDHAAATFKDGVLAITVKQPKRQGRRIEIEAGEGGQKDGTQPAGATKDVH